MKMIVFNLFMLQVLYVVTATIQDDPARYQLLLFKQNTSGPISIMTTGTGAPICYKSVTTLNKRRFPAFFMETITKFVRGTIAPRSVHAKGAGAFGYFELTHSLADICKAEVFQKVGKRTRIAVRFSLATADKGSADTVRDFRGFAIKFYTEDGIFDLLGLNTPTFAVKDPIHFPFLARTSSRNPATNLPDPNMFWDFVTLHPESLYMFLYLFSDAGIPYSYRHMPGFAIHTFQFVNRQGNNYFAKFCWLPDLGIKSLYSDEAIQIAGYEPDNFVKDLYNAIAKGKYPSWTLYVQVLTEEDVENSMFDPFDVTRTLPITEYPLRPVGKLVLNENPVNHFADMEQLAFCPSNLVFGILGGPDKLYEARRFAYRDAQNYRLGSNFDNIRVNCPFKRTYTYNRDGRAPVNDNMRDIPNYYPNSFNGPKACEDDINQLKEIHEENPNNFDQIRNFYVNLPPGEKIRLVENIVYSLGKAIECLQKRALDIFEIIHYDLSESVKAGLDAHFSMYVN